MKYKGIIFDMDGTIIDSTPLWQQVTRELLARKGIRPTPKELAELEAELEGIGLRPGCLILKKELGLRDSIEDLMREKQEQITLLFKKHVKFIDGFQNFHQKVMEKELKSGIATNADDVTLERAIEKLNLDKYFGEHIYNVTHVNNKHKPAPDLYLHAADKLELDPKNCVAIEDSSLGIKAAVDAGMFCIGINSNNNREALQEAHLIIDHYDEIELKKLLHAKMS